MPFVLLACEAGVGGAWGLKYTQKKGLRAFRPFGNREPLSASPGIELSGVELLDFKTPPLCQGSKSGVVVRIYQRCPSGGVAFAPPLSVACEASYVVMLARWPSHRKRNPREGNCSMAERNREGEGVWGRECEREADGERVYSIPKQLILHE
jgi:hypothetical protein